MQNQYNCQVVKKMHLVVLSHLQCSDLIHWELLWKSISRQPFRALPSCKAHTFLQKRRLRLRRHVPNSEERPGASDRSVRSDAAPNSFLLLLVRHLLLLAMHLFLLAMHLLLVAPNSILYFVRPCTQSGWNACPTLRRHRSNHGPREHLHLVDLQKMH